MSISVESINRDDNINDCEVNFNANISDNVINDFNGVSSVFSNDEFDLNYVSAKGKTNHQLFDNITESKLKYPKSLIIAHIIMNSLKKRTKLQLIISEIFY